MEKNNIDKRHGNITYKERKERIRGGIQNMAGEYIEIGYHLRAVQEGEEYREDGYRDIHEFALEEFGMAKATVNHCMKVNAAFSEGGNSPVVAEKYRGFSKSQLQEMLYIPEWLREEVKPDMSVKKIRGLKKERLDVEPEEKEEPQEEKLKPYQRGCITGWSRYPDCCSCCKHGGAECCSQCEASHNCNSRCGWVDDPYVPEKDIPEPMHVEDYPELMPEPEPCATSHTEDGGTAWGPSGKVEGSGKCLYREGFFCSLSEEAKRTPGDGEDCYKKCCWECTKRGCRLECISSETREAEPEPVADAEYREADGGMDDMIPFLAEAFLEQVDVEAWYPHTKGLEELHEQIKEDFFSNAIDFVYRGRKLRAQFLDEIRMADHVTGEELKICRWDQFFVEMDRAGAASEEYVDVEQGQGTEKREELSELTDIKLLGNRLEKEKKNLALLKEECTNRDWRVRAQELAVAALAAYICDLDAMLNPLPEPVQPELPALKNNDQRKEWLRDYKVWGLWYEDKNIGCKYYKYDFENGARLIAEVFLKPKSKFYDEYDRYYFHLVGGPKPPKDKTGCCSKWQWHKEYCESANSETELVEFLKYVQKKG